VEDKVLGRKSEGKGIFGKPTCSWENNIKMYLKEIGSSEQGFGTCEHDAELPSSIKFMAS
jgi:hypothetical protein